MNASVWKINRNLATYRHTIDEEREFIRRFSACLTAKIKTIFERYPNLPEELYIYIMRDIRKNERNSVTRDIYIQKTNNMFLKISTRETFTTLFANRNGMSAAKCRHIWETKVKGKGFPDWAALV